MTTDEKLAAILAAVQTDPGNRGLARVPHDNLFTATAGQFQAACRSIAEHPNPVVAIFTGFWIPSATPPAFETDGPLGVFLLQEVLSVPAEVNVHCEAKFDIGCDWFSRSDPTQPITHLITCERPGPTADGTFRTMRGFDITSQHEQLHRVYETLKDRDRPVTISIGDGGNEIGMGSITPTTMAKNITNSQRVRCVVPCDFLIVAGVSNWGAYALAAGFSLVRGTKHPVELFNSDRELGTLMVMVDDGPLVDGVTGRQEATVDGLPWDVYAAPLVRIREILELP